MATGSQMEGGWFSTCGSRLSSACILSNILEQKIHGLRAGGFQNVALALAPRILVLNMSEGFTD
eukprot:907914-Pyramimonas_sp.AAC.1